MRNLTFGIVAGVALLSGSAFAAGGEAVSPARGAEAAAPLRLEADLSDRKLHVYHSGSLVESYDVAVGEPEHPTPTGDFSISKVVWNPAWVPPPNAEWAEDETRKAPGDPDNPMRAAKIFFVEPDYYIHGTDAPHTLGEAASHGCIRMDPDDVERLARRVQDHGGESRSDSWYQTVMSSDTDKRTIHLSNPVSIEIHE